MSYLHCCRIWFSVSPLYCRLPQCNKPTTNFIPHVIKISSKPLVLAIVIMLLLICRICHWSHQAGLSDIMQEAEDNTHSIMQYSNHLQVTHSSVVQLYPIPKSCMLHLVVTFKKFNCPNFSGSLFIKKLLKLVSYWTCTLTEPLQ